ncbi:MAG: spore photoproduct lyase [Bacilli bacterium]
MDKPFVPDLVYFEPEALNYPIGERLYREFKRLGIPIRKTTSHNQIRDLPGDTDLQKYRMAKRTLVVGLRRTLKKFDPSLPSAEYAIPLATGCFGHCHYCYLQTTLGSKPYVRVYVNVEEILERAQQYIDERGDQITRFEAACTSDIVGIDYWTHALKETVNFIGQTKNGRLRFVTKYHFVDHLLDAKHNGHTTFRFSINADYVIKNFEPGTSPLTKRLEAARKVAAANYPLGFIVAPIYRFNGWEEGYKTLFEQLAEQLKGIQTPKLTFELIQHRFTKPAKKVILERYPKTKLEMNEDERKYKWGRYGIGKYVYKDDEAKELHETIRGYIEKYFPEAETLYFT